MTLIKSISGIRGTIGGQPGEGLNPLDLVKFTTAYSTWLKQDIPNKKLTVIVGRDARISGKMVSQIVVGTLNGMGINVINIGLATTPTTEMAVILEKADGGIILTASHNPRQWNALKLLNNKGEFLSAKNGEYILEMAEKEKFLYADIDEIGSTKFIENYNDKHIEEILKLKLVDVEAIKKANFKIVIDCVNSVGGISLPDLLKAIGVKEVVEMYCEPNGEFPHNPEPLPENLTDISKKVPETNANLGFVVDPDVDRLAIIDNEGMMFGEEYTLVAVADYILMHNPGNTVSNLSSTRALKDITEKYNKDYFASSVGEVNVVDKMKLTDAVIGGEGNGGIIYPELHYGRDALVGIALFLSHLARSGKKCSELRTIYPDYVISKNKVELTPQTNIDDLLDKIIDEYSNEKIITIDGVKIEFEKEWVHLRKSNTELIIRIYAESHSQETADALANEIINKIVKLM